MTEFVFTELVRSPHADIITTALGVDANNKLVENDIGKPVKLAANNNYVVCANGDPIDGFVDSIDAVTVNDGFSKGGVIRDGRKEAQVDAAEVGTAVVGTFVAAGTPAALGTKDTHPQVELITPAAGQPLWQVIRVISGTGVAGDLVLIERVK